MPRNPRRGRSVVIVTALAMLGTLAVEAPAYAAQSPIVTGELRDDLMGEPAETVTTTPAKPVAPGAWAPTAQPHVVVISSGVDSSVLPAAFQSSVSLVAGNEYPDAVGYGTWAASAIFQIAPGARVTSLNVYPNGQFQSGWVSGALRWARDNRTTGVPFDAVLLAYPPSDYVDPVRYARGQRQGRNPALLPGEDRDLFDLMLDYPLRSADGTSAGSVQGEKKRADYQLGAATDAEQHAVRTFHYRATEWQAATAAVRDLVGYGIPVVAPAGDLGTGVQSIGGLANLADVVTVGTATSTGAVGADSSSGPSVEGLAKPDLVAPVVAAAVAPAGSLLDALPAFVTDTAVAVWDGLDWAKRASAPRAWVESSMTAAALVATAAGGLHKEGVTDVATVRGALLAAAEPVADTPVWRQGGGVLQRTPDLAFAQSRPLVTGRLDLGLSPAAGTAWGATAAVVNGAAGVPTTRLTDFTGYGAHGQPLTRTVDPATAPPTTAAGGTSVSVAASSGSAYPGAYCGHTEVPLPSGIVIETEHVPTCLVQGMTFYAESRYIHNEPADHVTYELVPGIPPIVEGPLHRGFEQLPMDPTHLPLYVEKVRPGGCKDMFPTYPAGLDPDDADPATHHETCAVFESIPPGYYQTRLFTNYGAPVEWATESGTRTGDIGAATAYQKLSMWVLPEKPFEPVTGENKLAPRTENGAGQTWTVDDGNPATDDVRAYYWDPATNTWVVGEELDDAALRFAYGHVKRIVGANVASRVVDLLDYDAIAAVNGFSATTIGQLTRRPELDALPIAPDLSAWRWTKSPTDPTGFAATFNPLYVDTPGSLIPVGVAAYPIKLTTPNYLMHASVNVDFEVTDAVLEVVLIVGEEVVVRKIHPQGTSILSMQPSGLPKHDVPWGTAEGVADVEFRVKPKGVSSGMLYLVAHPTAIRQGGEIVYSAASVKLSGVSVEYDTWNNAFWPQVTFCGAKKAVKPGRACPAGGVANKLHVLPLATNFNPKQVVRDNCRPILGKQVCEDWTVLVHSPSKDARLYDVLTGGPDPGDPERPTTDITADLKKYGALRYAPLPDPSPEFTIAPVLNLGYGDLGTISFRQQYPFQGITNNRLWDNLVLPLEFVEKHRGAQWIRIENNRDSDYVSDDGTVRPIADRAPRGNVPVKSYVCYQTRSVTKEAPLL